MPEEIEDRQAEDSGEVFAAEAPAVFDTPTGVAHCLFCPGRHLRLSRLRMFDLSHILRFQFPVRCGRCGQRQYVPPLFAALSGRHKVLRGNLRKKKPQQSWASWTEVVPDEPKARPMTTVAEPRAARLEKKASTIARPATRRDDNVW